MKEEKEAELKQDMATKKKDKKFLDPNFKFLSGRSMFVYNPNDELDEEGDADDELQELIKNRKTKNIDEEDEDEDNNQEDKNGVKDRDENEDENEIDQEIIENVELPDDDFGE